MFINQSIESLLLCKLQIPVNHLSIKENYHRVESRTCKQIEREREKESWGRKQLCNNAAGVYTAFLHLLYMHPLSPEGGGDEHWGYKEKKHKLSKR